MTDKQPLPTDRTIIRRCLYLLILLGLAGCGTIALPQVALPTAASTAPPYDPAEFLPTEGIAGSKSLAYDIGLATVGQSRAPKEFSRMPVPLIGAIAVPEGDGPFPVAVVLHGRHPRCYSDEAQLEEVWPCPADSEPRYDIGFSYLLDALAERGYLAIAPSVNGAYTTEYGPGTLSLDEMQPWVDERMVQIVTEHLAGLNAASAGEPVFGDFLDLTGKVDSSRIALIAHSTAGITANLIARENQLPVESLLLVGPMHFAGTGATAGTPAAILLAACDGDRSDLPGQTYFENARVDPAREAPMVSIMLAGANHNFFNREMAAQGIDDGFFSRNPDCAEDRLAAADQQAFLAALAGDFTDAAFSRGAMPPFLGISEAAPTSLYENSVQIALAPPASQRLRLITPPDSATAEPPGAAAGPLEIALCAPGVACAEGMLQPGLPGQVRLSWNGEGAVYRVDVPENSAGYETLRLRAAVDPTHPLNSAAGPVAFAVRLTDKAGNQAIVELPAPLPFPPKGTYPGDDFRFSPVLPQDIRLPLAAFNGVDPSALAAVELIFDATPAGSIFLTDLELLRSPG
jgi:dienelactone hydrolase